VVTWPGGNWIERPDKKFLPLLLRKRAWPALVGVAIQPEKDGPFEVFIGICGPTQETWNTGLSLNRRLYGERSEFIGQESRQRIAKAIGRKEPQYPWWVHCDAYLRAGQDISDWRDTTTVIRLYSERDAVCKHIIGRMTELAAKIGSLVMLATLRLISSKFLPIRKAASRFC
jgi:hypothetical protein